MNTPTFKQLRTAKLLVLGFIATFTILLSVFAC